jgi:hypothetical protein
VTKKRLTQLRNAYRAVGRGEGFWADGSEAGAAVAGLIEARRRSRRLSQVIRIMVASGTTYTLSSEPHAHIRRPTDLDYTMVIPAAFFTTLEYGEPMDISANTLTVRFGLTGPTLGVLLTGQTSTHWPYPVTRADESTQLAVHAGVLQS